MKVRVISRSATAAGFELAGLAVIRVDDEAGTAEVLQRCAADGDVGMILVEDALFRTLPRDLVTRLDRQALPVIVPVPDARWDERSEAEAYILEILRQAIGYRVRAR